jgi:hypothetical protein
MSRAYYRIVVYFILVLKYVLYYYYMNNLGERIGMVGLIICFYL